MPGNHSQIKHLLSAFEAHEAFAVDQVLNPHTLVGFLKKALKDEQIGPLMPKMVQRMLESALIEAADDEAQVRRGLQTHGFSACWRQWLISWSQLKAVRNAIELMDADECSVLRCLASMFVKFLARTAMTKATLGDIARSFGTSWAKFAN